MCIRDRTYGYQTKDKFTSDDDFYRFYFKVVDNNIPITQKTYTTQANERGMEGSVVEVSVSKKGIMELRYSAIYQMQSTDAVSYTHLGTGKRRNLFCNRQRKEFLQRAAEWKRGRHHGAHPLSGNDPRQRHSGKGA